MEFTLALVKHHALARGAFNAIIDIIRVNDFKIIARCHFGHLDREKFESLYIDHLRKDYYSDLMDSVTPGSIALILRRENCIQCWRDLQGPTDPVKARMVAPESIRARFGGLALPDNATHGSDSKESAEREVEIFFPGWNEILNDCRNFAE